MSKENLSEQELAQKLQEIGKQKQEKFIEEYEKLSQKYGLNLGGQITVLQDGRLSVNMVLVPRQQ